MNKTMKKHLIWLPLIIVFLWMTKNWYYFDTFSASSWGPVSRYKMTTYRLPQAVRDSLANTDIVGTENVAGTRNTRTIIHGKILSVFSTQEPFARLWRYGIQGITSDTLRVASYPNTPGIPLYVLDVPEFKENGSNLNHWIYLDIGEKLKKDNTKIVGLYPYLRLGAMYEAWLCTLKPAWKWFTLPGHQGRRRKNFDVIFKRGE